MHERGSDLTYHERNRSGRTKKRKAEAERKIAMKPERIIHPFDPVYDQNSEILILGSLPSVKSRENNFYYGHPQNRFWKVLAAVFNEPVPQNIPEKTEILLKNHIALWDVINSCIITGSSDSSIKDVQVNDLEELIENSCINTIICNGKAAEKYYRKYQEKKTGIAPLVLPSTSPANATWSLEKLISVWKPAVLNSLSIGPLSNSSAETETGKEKVKNEQ